MDRNRSIVSARGYRPGTLVVNLHPDECTVRAADVMAGRLTCSRPDHEGRDCRVTPDASAR
jgi:hypothetical protein